MANEHTRTSDSLNEPGGAVGGGTAARATQGTGTVESAARSAQEFVENSRTAAADRLKQAAEAVRDRAPDLPGGDRVHQFAQTTADTLSTTADYIRTHDVHRVVEDVEAVVKRNPGPALLVAAAFGFLVGRALSRD